MSTTPMTTLTSAPSNGGHQSSLENFSVRRTESIDAPQIMKLIERSTEKCFGKINIVNVIEKAVLSITLTSSTGEVLGFGAFYDFPGGKAYSAKTWQQDMASRHNLNKVTPLNTLFLHYYVAARPYQHDIANQLLRTVFNACVYVHHIFLLSATAHIGSALLENFSRVKEGPKEEKLFLCERHTHVPQLHIREARPEDNDDLAPLFTQQSQVLSETYGDYFLAELIEAQDENHKALVAEVGGLAIGFMCISTEVDTSLLNKCFELKPYNYLHSTREEEEDDSSIGTDSCADLDEELGKLEREDTIEVELASVERKVASQLSVKSGGGEGGSSRGDVSGAESNRTVSIPPSHLSEQPSDISELAPNEVEDEPLPGIVEPEETLGVPSGFCIQLFCIDERYEMRSVDFMAEAFKRFADKDYCVITIPHTTAEFPLLQIFTRSTPKPTSTLEQELYVFHRSALLQNISVRFGRESDVQGVTYITRKYKGKSTVLTDYKQYLSALRDEDGTPLFGIVMECGDQIIGVALIRAEMDTEYLRSHYALEDFIYYTQHSPREHGHLHHCAVAATFTNYTKFFLRECLRLCEMSCFYHNVYGGEETHGKPQTTIEALHHLVQIKPRRQIKYPVELLQGKPPAAHNNVPLEDVIKSLPPFALFHINRKLTLEPKMIINSRIVVVGASDVALGFLETLILCPHIHFSNLVLVSPEGLPSSSPDSLPSSLCFSQRYMLNIALGTCCNIVQAKMRSINREEQFVAVDDGRKVQYDYLILATGAQFALPNPGVVESRLDIASPVYREVSAVTKQEAPESPANVMALDSISKAEGVVQWANDCGGPVAVYGSTLTAYTTIQALIAGGVSDIVNIQPPTPVSCFNNKEVTDTVNAAAVAAGVRIVRDMTLTGYQADGDEGLITGIHLSPLQGATEMLACSGLVSAAHKHIDRETFEAINNSCLVFDGKLVIDAYSHTNDGVIYAAGPLTKYKRALYCDEYTHEIYCSREIGERLAHIVLPLFDPSFPAVREVNQYELPDLTQPKQVHAVLPGGYHYLQVSKPEPLIDLPTAMMAPSYGRELITRGKDSYFRLHLNQYHAVETITCLSKEPIDVGNLCRLYGLHQEYMNSLEVRFDSGLITDFFSFFRETWSLLLYHDRFSTLREELRELLGQPNQPGEESLKEKICQLVDEDLAIEEKTRIALFEEYSKSLAKEAVESRLFSYLSYNNYHLPHFAGRNMA